MLLSSLSLVTWPGRLEIGGNFSHLSKQENTAGDGYFILCIFLYGINPST